MPLRVLCALPMLLLLAVPAMAQEGLPPDAPGPWSVGFRSEVAIDVDRDDRPLPLAVWYPVDPGEESGVPVTYPLLLALGIPSDLASQGPPVSDDGRRPLIVFSHGSGGINIQSVQLCEVLASHGFVVVAPAHTGNTTQDAQDGTSVPFLQSALDRPLDVSFVADHFVKRSGTPGDPFEDRVRTSAFGVAGHSFGGYTALAMASGWSGGVLPDPRFRAIMAISPASGALSDDELRSISRPLLLLSGTLDTTTPIDPDTLRPWNLASPARVYRADIVGATHTHFANICSIADALISAGIGPNAWQYIGAGALLQPYLDTCVPPAFPLDEALRIQDLYAVAFFRRHLLWQQTYDSFLTEAYALANEPDVQYFRRETTGCGLGFELVLVLLPIRAWRRSRRIGR